MADIMPVIEWISEAEALPVIGQSVFLAYPHRFGKFWDLSVVTLLCRHESVLAEPVRAGSPWPTDYYWGSPRSPHDTHFITGNNWWAYTDRIPLPPGAKHDTHAGYRIIRRAGSVFIPRGGENG